ncbi:hypothetical protein B9Z55_027276 [Caenorhabditis nigoni]|nr:hypothetical protein B9Z55_027276 [Caenorhabditis nigoni]
MLLHIILLLAIAISVTGFLSPKSVNEEIVRHLNNARAEYAKRLLIGNMHELTFNENLLKTAYSIANCDNKKGDFEIVKKSELRKNPKDRTTPKGYHPLQTRIACVKNLLTCKKYDEPICLLGPYSNPTDDQIKTGIIGSRCKYGVGELRLCKAPPATKA